MSRKAFLLLFIAAVAAFAAVGTLNVTIKEYEVPTPKSRPHDPARAPDGALWYTGQGANKLGRLDPSTGAFKEYPLKTPGSGPHGLVADSHGNIWFTAISAGYVGRLDPQPATSKNTVRPTKPKSIRTRRSSITTAPSGSPTKKPTTSAASIPRAAR
jgi:streptogramin lyase